MLKNGRVCQNCKASIADGNGDDNIDEDATSTSDELESDSMNNKNKKKKLPLKHYLDKVTASIKDLCNTYVKSSLPSSTVSNASRSESPSPSPTPASNSESVVSSPKRAQRSLNGVDWTKMQLGCSTLILYIKNLKTYPNVPR